MAPRLHFGPQSRYKLSRAHTGVWTAIAPSPHSRHTRRPSLEHPFSFPQPSPDETRPSLPPPHTGRVIVTERKSVNRPPESPGGYELLPYQ